MHATLRNYRQAPRKVRAVTTTLKGKSVTVALAALSLMGRKAADPLAKLIRSAVANAKEEGKTKELFIQNISVNKGFTFKRFMPRARGRAAPIHKESSHVVIELGLKEVKVPAAPRT